VVIPIGDVRFAFEPAATKDVEPAPKPRLTRLVSEEITRNAPDPYSPTLSIFIAGTIPGIGEYETEAGNAWVGEKDEDAIGEG
jgi:hypothetical protein